MSDGNSLLTQLLGSMVSNDTVEYQIKILSWKDFLIKTENMQDLTIKSIWSFNYVFLIILIKDNTNINYFVMY